jgi:hypothetical protein
MCRGLFQGWDFQGGCRHQRRRPGAAAPPRLGIRVEMRSGAQGNLHSCFQPHQAHSMPCRPPCLPPLLVAAADCEPWHHLQGFWLAAAVLDSTTYQALGEECGVLCAQLPGCTVRCQPCAAATCCSRPNVQQLGTASLTHQYCCLEVLLGATCSVGHCRGFMQAIPDKSVALVSLITDAPGGCSPPACAGCHRAGR